MPHYSSATERFWAKVEFTEDCWLWTASLDSSGYGVFKDKGRFFKAHRWAYALYECIPSGLELDHLCRVRHCVRPEHLEPVTGLENNRRRILPRPSVCIRGHVFSAATTYVKSDGSRRCNPCNRIRDRARRLRKKS